MKLIQIKRIFKTGILNVIRAPFVSFSATLIMTITLFLIGISFIFGKMMNDVIDDLKDKVDITVYFSTDADESDILELKSKVEALPQARSVFYVNRDKVLAEYKAAHQNEPDLLAGLDILSQNPFRAKLSIKAKDANELESISRFIQNEDVLSDNQNLLIDKIDYYQNKKIIIRLTAFINTIENFSTFFIGLLIILSFVIVFNVIRLVIYLSKDEISVMKLIGADDFYIRTPFLISGAIYGITGMLIAFALLYPASIYITPYLQIFLDGKHLVEYVYANFFTVLLILLLSGVFIGSFSSYIASKRYLI